MTGIFPSVIETIIVEYLLYFSRVNFFLCIGNILLNEMHRINVANL